MEEAFIGYQKDSPAAAIFQATKQCRQMRNSKLNCDDVPIVPKSISVDKLNCQDEGSEYWKNAVSVYKCSYTVNYVSIYNCCHDACPLDYIIHILYIGLFHNVIIYPY